MEVNLKIFLNSIFFILFGLSSFAQKDSISIKKQWLKSSIAPTLLMSGSLYTLNKNVPFNKYDVQQKIQAKYPNFHSEVDDYILYIPIAIPYILDWSMKGYAKNDFINRSILLAKSQLIMMGIVYPLKYTTKMIRPDGRATNSYPSGHTAQAFMAATFMHKELKHKSYWYSIGAYSIATIVGGYRMLNNRHWISDVFAGAAIGILSTEIAYLTHQYKWGKRENSVSFRFTPIFYTSLD